MTLKKDFHKTNSRYFPLLYKNAGSGSHNVIFRRIHTHTRTHTLLALLAPLVSGVTVCPLWRFLDKLFIVSAYRRRVCTYFQTRPVSASLSKHASVHASHSSAAPVIRRTRSGTTAKAQARALVSRCLVPPSGGTIPSALSSCLLLLLLLSSRSECFPPPSINTVLSGALPACLPNLPDGLSQSLECLKPLVVPPDTFIEPSTPLISLSYSIPGRFLCDISVPSVFFSPLLPLIFFFLFHSVPSLPRLPATRGSTSWPGRRICQHIFSGLAVRNVRHRL